MRRAATPSTGTGSAVGVGSRDKRQATTLACAHGCRQAHQAARTSSSDSAHQRVIVDIRDGLRGMQGSCWLIDSILPAACALQVKRGLGKREA